MKRPSFFRSIREWSDIPRRYHSGPRLNFEFNPNVAPTELVPVLVAETLRFWVDCSYEDQRYDNSNRTRNELIADILRDYERSGHAMRYLNVKGQIAWKASPRMLSMLADLERDAEGDLADWP